MIGDIRFFGSQIPKNVTKKEHGFELVFMYDLSFLLDILPTILI